MELNPRLLAFLQHEMEKIAEDESRRGSEQKHALRVLEAVEDEIITDQKQTVTLSI